MINYTEVPIVFNTDAGGFLTFSVSNPMDDPNIATLIQNKEFFPHLYIIFPLAPVRILFEYTTFTWNLAGQGNFTYEFFSFLQEDDPSAYPVHPLLRPV